MILVTRFLVNVLYTQYAPAGSNAMGPDAFRSTGDATATWIARITATRLDAASAPPPPPPLHPPLPSPPRSWRSPSWPRTPSPSRPCIAGRKDVCRPTTSATGWWTVLGVRMNDIAVSKTSFSFFLPSPSLSLSRFDMLKIGEWRDTIFFRIV